MLNFKVITQKPKLGLLQLDDCHFNRVRHKVCKVSVKYLASLEKFLHTTAALLNDLHNLSKLHQKTLKILHT